MFAGAASYVPPPMLSDRSYMRDDYPRQGTSALTWLISGIVAMFVLQFVFLRWFHFELENLLALSVPNILSSKVWVVLSYGLLHSTGNLLHIIVNLLGLYFLGRVLEPIMGSKRFVGFFASAVLAGALLWLGTHWQNGHGVAIGASAGVIGLLVVFACLNPNQPMTFLLFFILPVTLKPKYVALALLAIELIGFAFYEIMGAVSPFSGSVAHSAHLGGMAAGWLYFRYVHSGAWRFPTSRSDVELPGWLQKRQKKTTPETPYQVDVPKREDLRAEVDRILDKINSHGFGSLTPEEKRLLDEARDLLSRR